MVGDLTLKKVRNISLKNPDRLKLAPGGLHLKLH
jgi:hypothetical protein